MSDAIKLNAESSPYTWRRDYIYPLGTKRDFTMRFSSITTIPVMAWAGPIRLSADVPQYPDENIDIRLTKEQTKIFEEILEQKVSSSIEKTARAIAGGSYVRLWDENYDPREDRFLLAYYFDETASHTEKQRNLIRKSFGQYGDYTCVKMVEVSKNDPRFKNKLQLTSEKGCYSYVGRHFEHQEISLGADCEYGTYPIHEVMHALGFWHEHQRPDRNEHISIHRNRTYLLDEQFTFAYSTNIWEVYEWEPSGTDYDIHSITHYTSSMFSKDPDIPVMTYLGTNDPLVIHNSKTFSPNDIIDINFKYACNQTGFKKFTPQLQADFSSSTRYSDCVKLEYILTYIYLTAAFIFF